MTMPTSGVYEYLAQDRVIYGTPAAKAVLDTVNGLGSRRVLVVSSATLSRKTDEIQKIRSALGDRYVGLFDECVEHVPRKSVLQLAELARELQPDLIVTVGGGTPMDTTKVALVALAEDIRDVDGFDAFRIRVDEAGNRVVPAIKPPPVRQIIVPTTLSGAEFSNIGGCTDPVRQVKDLYTARFIGGQVVILDPAITVHTPSDLWISTGVRAIDHAVETVCSRKPQPMTDATCLHGLTLLSRSLRRNLQEPGDMNARLESQLAVWLASTGLGRIEWGASHGIGHQLGAVAGVPHGHCSCVMLPSVLLWNRSTNAGRQTLVAHALGREDGDAAQAVADLVADLGQPVRLRDVGVRREHFDAICRGALQNMMVRSNPRPVQSDSDVLEILELAW